MRTLPVAVLFVALGWACSPAAPQLKHAEILPPEPTPAPAPTPSPGPTGSRVSGIVTDEGGSPLANVQIEVEYRSGNRGALVRTQTDGRGYYEAAFESTAPYFWDPSVAGVVAAFAPAGYDSNIQSLPLGAADIVRNLRLRRHRTISAGQSIVIGIERDSSLAVDLDSVYRLNHVWEWVDIGIVGPGTLTVEARPVDAAGSAPTMHSNYVGSSIAPGTVSLPVQAGRVWIAVSIPIDTAPQRYEVFTSLKP